MQIYLLAANFLALVALLIGRGSPSRSSQPWSLFPLFLLVISRLLSLIFALIAPTGGYVEATLGSLEVLSVFCLIWTLTGLPIPWPKLIWLAGGAVLLALLLFISNWPAPAQIHVLLAAVCGAPFILFNAKNIRWPHLAIPFVLALANFLSLLDLTELAWFVNLLAYTLFITVIHGESVQAHRQLFDDRQKAGEALVQEAIELSRERQRWLEVSEIISATPNPSQSMEHIARCIAQITQVDQSGLFMLDAAVLGQIRLVTLYNPNRPIHLLKNEEIVFHLEACPLLREAIDRQRQLLLPSSNGNGLGDLYALWQENQAGPTLLQPLTVHGRPVGVLMLGNPVSHRPIQEGDARLCRTLAPQIATLMEHRRRYLELEAEAETMVKVALKQNGGSIEQLSILEIISDGLVVSDAAGRVQLVNRAAERILNKPRAELLNQSIGAIYGTIDSTEPIEDLAMAFSRRNQPLPTFFENEERAIQGRLIPWRDEQGEWKGIVALFRDVTREIKADRARNDFIAALSRELRAPLTTIKGYSDLILQGILSNYSPEQIHVQQIIYAGADRMTAVLDNAIQLSAQNRCKILPRFEEIEVSKVIDEVLHDITPLAHLRELKLGRDIQEPLPPFIADPKHIRQILDNLLTNACHFTPPGGQIALRVWVEQDRVEQRPYLLIAVADNGVGIPRSEHKRIFDPFYQIKNHPVEADIGMGMGLTVVKELVELHNGRVRIESMVGQGSVFQVALPLTQEY